MLALVGGIIFAGFLANVIFKVFKIPSVVKLMGIGLLLGPVFKVLPGDQFMDVAPVFGNLALLIILFAGGLGLRIQTVIAQLGNAVLLALAAFLVTFGLAIPACIYILDLPTIQAIILATLIAGTASSIVIPVVTKLSVGESLKTMLSIESALSNLLILVVVIIACDIQISDNADILSILITFVSKILVSLVSAVIAGVVWARLIGSMSTNQLSYMLTLGFIFVLNFLVDLAGGNGAISILFFGITLANVSAIAAQFGPKVNRVLGIKVDSTKFVLNEFLKGISGELSFLVATFFFVFLGLLVSFDALTPEIIRNILILIGIVVLGRLLVVPLFSRFSRTKYSFAESVILLAMMPRGLATAVMAFRPAEEPYFIDGTELFPLYAMMVILGSNLIMTGVVALGEILLKKERAPVVEAEKPEIPEAGVDEPITTFVKPAMKAEEEPAFRPGTRNEPPDYSYAFTGGRIEIGKSDKEEELPNFSERLHQWLRIRKDSFVLFDQDAIQSLRIRDAMYWVKLAVMGVITLLGLMMDSPSVVIAALLLSPVTSLFNTIANGIITGDIYIFLKGNFKFLISSLLLILLCALVTGITPFTGMTSEISERLTPHVLDFLLALVTGMILPVILLRGNKFEIMAITPVVGLLLIPPLAVVGFAFGAGTTHNISLGQILGGGILSYAASFTAMIIGSVFSQWLLGLTRHPASSMVSEWKEKEVQEGVLHRWFERLRLVRAMETVGTFYARIIVLGILAIAVFVPLQITYNKLQEEYTIDQVLEQKSREFFEKKDGSASVITRNFVVRNKKIELTMSVVTPENYARSYARKFEDEVEKKVGIPVNLRLVQFNSEYAGEGELSTVPGEEVREMTILQKMEALEADLERVENELPDFSGLEVVQLRHQHRLDEEDSELVVECFNRDGILHPDSKAYLVSELSKRLGISPQMIHLVSIPVRYTSEDPTDLATFRDRFGLFDARKLLKKEPRIGGEFFFPESLKGDSLEVLFNRLKANSPLLNDTARFHFGVHDEESYLLLLK